MNNAEEREYQINDYTISVHGGGLEIRYKDEEKNHDPFFREDFKAHYDIDADRLETENELVVIGDQGIPEEQLYFIKVNTNPDNTSCVVNDTIEHISSCESPQ